MPFSFNWKQHIVKDRKCKRCGIHVALTDGTGYTKEMMFTSELPPEVKREQCTGGL